MSSTFESWALKPGVSRLKAKRDVRGSTRVAPTHPESPPVASFNSSLIKAGEVVVFEKHDQGWGSDAAYEVHVKRENGIQVAIQVGWGHLSTDDFELL